MTRLMLVAVLALLAVAGTACSDENLVGPSSLPTVPPGERFRNEMVFVPDALAACVARTPPAHGRKPGPC